MSKDYISSIREKVGHSPIILVFSGGILVNDKDEVLLQKRSDFEKWGLPGGTIEFGESSVDACKREFLEETGLEVDIKSLLGISSKHIQKYPNGDVSQSIVITYLVKNILDKTLNYDNETLAMEYFSYDNLPQIFNNQHLDIINHYYNNDYPYYD